MRLSVLLILLVLIAICAAKSSKSKKQKDAKAKVTKTVDDKKHKDEKQHKDTDKHKADTKKHKDANKKHDSKDSKKKDEKSKKTNDKATNKTASVEKKDNSTKATLLKNPPSDCQNIIDDYSNGKLLMYEYKIQMARCMKKAKDDADGTKDADVKSALLRPDDSPREDTDQAIHVRPFNSDQNYEHDSEDDYETDPSKFSEHNNDNENDYSDNDDDDDDDDDDDRNEHDEKAAKKMQVPESTGFQAPIAPMQNMAPQQQAMPGQQAASYYPNMAQTPLNGAPVQNLVPGQSQSAYAPGLMNQYPANPAPFQPADPNMGLNAVAKNTIPDNTQPPANEANAVFDQWRASSFSASTVDKKDQTPNTPAAPVNDQFAEFMKLQSASSSPMEAAPASQQTAMPAASQQRSDIAQQPNMFSMQPQAPNTVPGQGQAFYMQPEEHGNFPENP